MALLLLAPLVWFGMLECVGLVAGVDPVSENEHYRVRDYVQSCRWSPDHVERMCGRPWSAEGRSSIFVFGGNSVAPNPARGAMTEELQGLLDAAHPGQYAVRNLGRACKDSFFVVACVARSLAAHPDLIVVYSGHNDFGGYLVRWPRLRMIVATRPWLIDLRRLLARTRAYSLFAGSSARALQEDRPLARDDPDWDLERSIEIVVDAYRENLVQVVELARTRGIPVVLVTLVSNLYEFPIPRDEWDRVLARERAGDAPLWMTHYARGIEYARERRFEEARAAFKRSRDLFYPSQRAAGVLNQAVRALAEREPDVHLVDFEAELDRRGGWEPIGCNFFGNREYCDGVHPNRRTNRMIGEALFRKVEELRAGAEGNSY